MYGVGSRLPYLVQTLVVALKAAQIGNIAVAKSGSHLLQQQVGIVAQHIDAREAEARVAALSYAQPGHLEREVAHGVVVGGSVLAVDVAHGLLGRLTEAYAQLHGQLCAEIEKQGA